MSLRHELWFSNPYISAEPNDVYLRYFKLWFMLEISKVYTSDCKNIEIRKFEFVTKTQFLSKLISPQTWQKEQAKTLRLCDLVAPLGLILSTQVCMGKLISACFILEIENNVGFNNSFSIGKFIVENI